MKSPTSLWMSAGNALMSSCIVSWVFISHFLLQLVALVDESFEFRVAMWQWICNTRAKGDSQSIVAIPVTIAISFREDQRTDRISIQSMACGASFSAVSAEETSGMSGESCVTGDWLTG